MADLTYRVRLVLNTIKTDIKTFKSFMATKGANSGLASLDSDGRLTGTQYPSTVYRGFIDANNTDKTTALSDAGCYITTRANITISTPSNTLRNTGFIYHISTYAVSTTISLPYIIDAPQLGIYGGQSLTIYKGEDVVIYFEPIANRTRLIAGSAVDRLARVFANNTQSVNAPNLYMGADGIITKSTATQAKPLTALSVTMPAVGATATVAHGLTTTNINLVNGIVTGADGVVYQPNDQATNSQYSLRVNGANIVVACGASASNVAGKTLKLYVGQT